MKAPDRNALALAALFLLEFLVLYGGTSALSAWVPWRVPLALPGEAGWPLRPAWSLVYLSLDLLLALPLVVFPTGRSMAPLFVALSAETLVSALIFLLFPAELPPIPQERLAGTLGLARTLAMPRNALPSLHVAYAITVAAAFSARLPRVRPIWWGWAGAIALSTVLTRQHWVLDVAAGVALGAWGIRYLRVPNDWIDTAAAEVRAAREALRIARRHRRYLGIALAIWGGSIGRWRARRAARLGYALLQVLDDLLDGDRPCAGDPRHVAEDVIATLEGRPSGDLALLASEYAREVRALTREEDPVATTTALVRVMIADCDRRLTHATWDAERLRAHHFATFSGSIELLLTAAGARMRAKDVPSLIEAFGPVSTLRDLDEDLAHGLYNVPAPVLAQVEAPFTRERIEATSAGQTWIASERARCRDALQRAEAELARADDPVGVPLLGVFHRSMRRFA